jgi:NADPH:quinone reductase-like Zn-dependent oxidoreductase
MKAAVLRKLGSAPVYSDFAEPIPHGGEQVVMNVKAAALKNIDKLRASGLHYASYREVPVVVGTDGVGTLHEGTIVYAQGITGMMAEKAVIARSGYTVLPPTIDLALAAALPNAVFGSALALRARAKMSPGDVVLVNGATGATGQLAVQIAKYYGASKVVATGRRPEALGMLKTLGADRCISLESGDEAVTQELVETHRQTPFDVVLDFLWGHPMELILKAVRVEGINPSPRKVKIVSVGDIAGSTIMLDSGTLRGTDVEILGSGLGTFSRHDLREFSMKILPEMFDLAAKGRLKMETQAESLRDIERIWNKEPDGKRIVVTIE